MHAHLKCAMDALRAMVLILWKVRGVVNFWNLLDAFVSLEFLGPWF